MADLIPGINVKNLLAQVGQAIHNGTTDAKHKTNYDLDILDNYSVRGGDRSPANGKLFGRTNSSAQTLNKIDIPTLKFGTDVPDSPTGTGGGGSLLGGGGEVDEDAAARTQLRNEIMAKGGDIEAIYSALFGDLDNVVKSRDSELESQYGEQFKKAADQYAGALPTIENSYAALGSDSSTDSADAKTSAKKGFDDTTATIGKNKEADKAKLGQYRNEQAAKINADKESARTNLNRAGETTDVDALRTMRNDLESNLSNANVTRATLGTDGKAKQDLSALTSDSGRYDAAINSLDSIIKSSMSGAVKEAAVKAVTDNGGLSDDEKKKVQQTYGNVYAEQAAL